MLFLATLLCFGVTWVTIVLYLRSAHALLTELREQHPDFWRDTLGSPRFEAHHRHRGLSLQYRWYLQPLLPFLKWLLGGTAAGLAPDVAELHRRTRQYFVRSGVGLALTICLNLALFLGL